MSTPLGAHLAERRSGGARLLICYLMAQSTPEWLDVARACVDAGADALEVGIAFSDPLIDGPVIQAAGTRALADGATLATFAASLRDVDLGVPLVAMTYLNVFARPGYARACELLAAAGVRGAIVPDLPLDELPAWHDAAHPAGIETVLLAAPSSTPERRAEIAARSEAFVYAVGRMATTGERDQLDPAGAELVASLRRLGALPVCLGVGVAGAAQAAEVARGADGVVVGSAIVRRMLEGRTPSEVGAFVASLRTAIDGVVAG